MSGFRKKQYNNKRNSEREEPNGKINLWIPKGDKKYVISGTVRLEDGNEYRVFIYETQEKMYENGADYYGYLYLKEDEQDEEEVQPKRKKKSFNQQRPKVTKITPDFDDEDEDDSDDDIKF